MNSSEAISLVASVLRAEQLAKLSNETKIIIPKKERAKITRPAKNIKRKEVVCSG